MQHVFKEGNMLVRLLRRARHWIAPVSALLLVLLGVSSAWGQGRCCPPTYQQFPQYQQCPTPQAPTVEPPQPPVQPSLTEPPSVEPLAFGATDSGETFAAAIPNVIGDGGVRATTAAAIRASAFKIAENESPRPYSRVYFDYNYFNDVNNTGRGVNRYMPGFEQAFLDGNASFGMRLPVYGVTNGSDNVLGIQGFGNLNMIGKYAFINDRQTGNVLSGGMLLSAPTGREIPFGTGGFRDAIFEPFAGYIWVPSSSFYLQGFSSVAVPTDARDFTIMFNDIAAGWWAYRNNTSTFLNGVIPTLETHINTPLNHVGLAATNAIGVQNSVVLTAGAHVVFGRSILTLGVADPVTGPKPFDVEAIAQFNFRY
jgi:hypothetical protein